MTPAQLDVATAETSSVHGNEIDELRAEVVRLRQANHRLIARFATAGRSALPPVGGEAPVDAVRAAMAGAAADLRREVERTVQVRDHLSGEWASLHTAKARLRETWEHMEQRRGVLDQREVAVSEIEREQQASRIRLGRDMAELARNLDGLVRDPWAVVDAGSAPYVPRADRPNGAVSELEPVGSAPVTERSVQRAPALVSTGSGSGGAVAQDLDGDYEEQERFDRFFSDDIETEPSRTWLEG